MPPKGRHKTKPRDYGLISSAVASRRSTINMSPSDPKRAVPTAQTIIQRPLCTCVKPMGSKAERHNFGSHEAVESTAHGAFLSLIIPQLSSYVIQHQLELLSARARSWERVQKRASEIRARDLESAEQAKQQRQKYTKEVEAAKAAKAFAEEQSRLEINARAAEEAQRKGFGFLTFRYSRSVEERSTIGPWPRHQLVQPDNVTVQTRPAGLLRDQATAFTTYGNIDLARLSPDGSNIDVAPSAGIPPTPLDSPTQPDKMSSIQPQQQPLPRDITGGVESSIKDVIQNLFVLQQNVAGFRAENQAGLNHQVSEIARSLSHLEDLVSQPTHPLHKVKIAPEIIEYVDDGRNPDIFTRDFVELVQRGNAVVNGKQKAFRDFSRVLAEALKENFEGLDEEVDMIMDDAGMVQREDGRFVDKSTSLQNGNGSAI